MSPSSIRESVKRLLALADDAMMVDMLRSERSTRFGYQGTGVVVFVMLALTIINPIEIGVAVTATAILVASRSAGSWGLSAPERTRVAGLAAAAFLLALGLAAWQLGPFVAAISAILLPLALIAGYLSMKGKLEERGPRILAAGLLVIMVLTIGFIRIVAFDPPAIDVLDLHISAAEVLLDGGNPYTEATALDTGPNAGEGAVWVGYPYPPLTMIAYSGSFLIFGDPRWATVIAMAIVVILLVRPWVRLSRVQAGAFVALGLALVAQPVLGHVIRSAWTDALALPFLVGVGLLWRRNPLMAAVLLGLAFGTKQYFILALPLLLVWGDDYRWKRFWIAGGVAALSIAPAFVIGPRGAWDALVVAHLDTALRLDSIGVAGIGWDTPLWLLLAATAGVALWMGWAGGPASRFMLGLAATLAIAFLLGSQAFLNYWFFIGCVAIVAVASDDRLAAPVSVTGDTLRVRNPA